MFDLLEEIMEIDPLHELGARGQPALFGHGRSVSPVTTGSSTNSQIDSERHRWCQLLGSLHKDCVMQIH